MRRLAWFSGGACGAMLLFAAGVSLNWQYAAALVFLIGAAGLTLFKRTRLAGRCAAVLFLGYCAGLGWARLDYQKNVVPLEPFDGSTQAAEVMALEASKETAYGTSTTVELPLNGTDCRALLYGGYDLRLHPGDRVTGEMRIKGTGAGSGEDGIYYGARGVDLRLYLKGEPAVTRAGKLPPRLWPAAFVETLKDQLSILLSDPERGFETALLTGDRSGLEDDLYDDMGLAGTRHIVAVSGMHVGILAGFLLLLRRKKLAAFLGLPLLLGFGLCVGLSASVVRAIVMQAFLLFAPVFDRENDPPTSLLTALLLVLLPNPRAILDAGLQLSFGSAAGILLFSEHILGAMWGSRWCKLLRGKPGWWNGAVRTVLSSIAASLSVIPLTLPLQVYYFELFSLVSPLSAAVLVPLLPLAFSLGVLAALASLLWLPLGMLLARPLGWLLRGCIALTRLLAGIPFAAVSSRNVYLLIFLIGLYAVALCLLLSRQPGSFRLAGWSLAGLFILCVFLSVYENDRAALTMTALDVGQGQCVCFQSGGRAALYDCGGEQNPAETAVQFLQGSGHRSIDFLAVSHYDADHAGGVPRLLRRLRVGTLFLPETPDESGMQAEILDAAERAGCEVRFVTEDLTLPFGGALAFLYAPVNEGEGNDASIAARFAYGDFDMLLTGDMGVTAEKKLIYEHQLQKVEVIVAGHHGAAASTGTGFLNILLPRLVLISAGEDNSYGHPAQETLDRIRKTGAQVYRTDQCGSITVRCQSAAAQ